MPTETQLCELYGVSRITVWRAISELRDEGVLEKRPGKRTLVSFKRVMTSLVKLNGFPETCAALGADPHSQTLAVEEQHAEPATTAALDISKDTPVIMVRRLIRIRKGPLSIDTSSFERAQFPALAKRLHDDISLYRLLHETCGVEVGHSRRQINLRLAGHADRRMLDCKLGKPLFDMEKGVHDAQMRPIQRSILSTLASRITYTIHL